MRPTVTWHGYSRIAFELAPSLRWKVRQNGSPRFTAGSFRYRMARITVVERNSGRRRPPLGMVGQKDPADAPRYRGAYRSQ
jgi:hypothetical protein